MPSETAFIQHLKSPAHRNEKLSCTGCLRYFATATALTQHSESQGVRCKVRETDNYGGVVDEVTGGTARTAGRLDDDTIKYEVAEGLVPNDMIAAHRAAHEAKNRKFNNYWEANKPKW